MSSWRRLGEAGEDPAPRSVGAIIDHYVDAEGLGEVRSLEKVLSSWEDVVGAEVAQHVAPHTLKLGMLVVTVDHPSWATELRFIETEILTRLESQLGGGVVTSMRARVAP